MPRKKPLPESMTSEEYNHWLMMNKPEKAWQKEVVDYAKERRWLVFHFPQMLGNPKGWPDLIAFRAGQFRLIELKKMGGVVSDTQKELHAKLTSVGVPVAIFYPDQWGKVQDYFW